MQIINEVVPKIHTELMHTIKGSLCNNFFTLVLDKIHTTQANKCVIRFEMPKSSTSNIIHILGFPPLNLTTPSSSQMKQSRFFWAKILVIFYKIFRKCWCAHCKWKTGKFVQLYMMDPLKWNLWASGSDFLGIK